VEVLLMIALQHLELTDKAVDFFRPHSKLNPEPTVVPVL
jgi:hypothetical protein